MKPLDIIPLHYWATTRLKGLAGAINYGTLTWGVLVLGLAASGAWSVTHLALLGLCWSAYSCVYEFGYMANDFWSQPREVRANQPYRRPLSVPPPLWLITVAILSRVLLLTTAFVVLKGFGQSVLSRMLELLLTMATVFALHNIIMGRLRLVTFLTLQLLRYYLLGLVSDAPDLRVFLFIVAFPPSLAATVSYGRIKGYLTVSRNTAFRTVSHNLRLMSALYFGEAALCLLVRYGALAQACFVFAAVSFGADLAYIMLRIARRVLASLSFPEVRLHAHTEVSHDASWTAMEMARQAVISAVKVVYVTEHVEDLTQIRFADAQTACAAASERYGVLLVPGIEYTICNQHFLAIGIRALVEIDICSIDSIGVLQAASEAVIWAHPRIGFRRLYRDKAYARELLHMGRVVNAVEWLNLKPSRHGCAQLRYFGAFCVAVYCGSPCGASVGIDAHSASDWKNSDTHLVTMSSMLSPFSRLMTGVLGCPGDRGIYKEPGKRSLGSIGVASSSPCVPRV